MKRMLPLVVMIVLTGAGCLGSTPAPSKPSLPLLPVIRLERPTNGSTTTATSTDVVGSSNMPFIWVNGKKVNVIQGRFSTSLPLTVGDMPLSLVAGNGETTTTLPLLIHRSTDATSTHN